MAVIETIKDVVYILGFCLSACLFIVSCFSIKKSKKSKGQAEEEKISLIDLVTTGIPQLIKTAEVYFGSGKGPIKKDFVIERVQNLCYRAGLNFDEDLFNQTIENYISMTNNVNTNKKIVETKAKEEVENVYPRR